MTVTSPSPVRSVREPQWTPRQREVLDLLVRRKTNGEIAEALGISLDGAKWHVSEIITRLGVDSRDEAAEYWRHHNGLRMRFSRVASGFFGSGALKWAAGTVFVAGVAVVSAMVIVALRGASGDDSDPSVGDPPANTAVPSPAPGTPPAATPPAATPPPGGETINGVPVTVITFGKPGPLPVPLSVIIETGCFQCDGPAGGFERATLDARGNVVTELLYKPATGYISHSYWDSANRTHYLSVCSRGYCGELASVSADAQTTVLRSTDGGVTWQAVETFDGDVGLAGPTQQGFLLNRSVYLDTGTDWRFQVLGSSTMVRPPAGTEPEFAYGRPTLIGWRKTGTNDVLNLAGSPLVTLPALGNRQYGQAAQVAAVLGDDVLVMWADGPSADDVSHYLGVMENGALTKVLRFHSTSGWNFFVGDWLTKNAVFGNALVSPADLDPARSSTAGSLHPVWLDLQTGQLNVLELYGAAFSDSYRGRNYIREVEPGPFLRVSGAGDCLNVRESASTSARSLGCFADNVLLRDLSGTESAGGITWRKVGIPDGRQGWASGEFLK